MIIESIRVKNFLSHQDSTLNLIDEPLWLICGENGAGKSAFFDALEYVLYGEHRGGGQQERLLIKHGATRSLIEVVFRIEGRRLRLRHDIDRKNGNLGAVLDDLDAGKPISVPSGKQGVMLWLQSRTPSRIPSHALFRSAICLRQNDAAHFLSGNQSKRSEKFASLVDLTEYTRLSKVAEARQRRAEQERGNAETLLGALGDISDQAMEATQERFGSAERELEAAQTLHAIAQTLLQDTKRFHDLQYRQSGLERELVLQAELLADERQIKEAAARVREWDSAAPTFERYWSAANRAAEFLQRAEDSDAEREKALEDFAEADGQRQDLSALLKSLSEQRRPEAANALDAAKVSEMALRLEVRVAECVANLSGLAAKVEPLRGAQVMLVELQARRSELIQLERLASTRFELGQAQAKLVAAEERADEAAAAERTQQGILAEAEAAHEAAEAAAAQAAEIESQLREEIAQLAGRIGGHEGLQDGQSECPTCGQDVSEGLIAHVQEQVAQERLELAATRRRLAEQSGVLGQAKLDRQAASKARDEARGGMHSCAERRSTAQSEARRLELDQADRQTAYDAALADAGTSCVWYAAEIPVADRAWVGRQHPILNAKLKEENTRATELVRLQHQIGAAEGERKALVEQRSAGAEPLGDSLVPGELRGRLSTAEKWAEASGASLQKIDAQIATADSQRQLVAQEAAICTQSADSAGRNARDQREWATSEQQRADVARDALGPTWAAVLADESLFEATQSDVDDRRPIAGRERDLLQASGRKTQLESDLAKLVADQDGIPLSSRVPLNDAQRVEAEASEAVQTARAEKQDANGAITALHERRAHGAKCREAIGASDEEANTFRVLFDLLKPNGAIQTRIVAEVQREITEEVNKVLELLSDSLHVRLGEAKRGGAGGVRQDLHITDMQDPFCEPRYFEFLSGGEQFRVALALALAIHRRVGRQAGTIIVDEGFGALDGRRRDALARSLADSGEGILKLRLATNVVICSHSDEVRRYFPHRWHVRKTGGTATVEREDDEGDAG